MFYCESILDWSIICVFWGVLSYGCRNKYFAPTVVDLTRYQGNQQIKNSPLVIGWIGSHSTSKYLLSISSVITLLTKDFNVRIVAECEQALYQLLNDKNLRSQMGNKGRDLVESMYSLQIQAPRLERLMSNVLRQTI